jgi:hypothetical protein
MKRIIIMLACGLGLQLGACSEEGPAEKAGRHLDETVEKLRDTGNGTLERLREDLDDVRDAADEALENARKAAKNAGR